MTLTFGAVWSSGTLPTEVKVVSRRAKLWKPSPRGGAKRPVALSMVRRADWRSRWRSVTTATT